MKEQGHKNMKYLPEALAISGMILVSVSVAFIYLPAAGRVGVLPVSKSQRPFALLPQILNVLKAKTPMVMFVFRENNTKYLVDTNQLTKDMDGGEEAIKKFQEEYTNKEYNFSSLYQRIDNEQLRNIPEIARLLQLKGLE